MRENLIPGSTSESRRQVLSREESCKGEGENGRVGLSARNRTEVELRTSFPTSLSGVQESHVVLGRGLDARDSSQTIGEQVDAGGKQGRSKEGRIGGRRTK